jgi:hypothetical protein
MIVSVLECCTIYCEAGARWQHDIVPARLAFLHFFCTFSALFCSHTQIVERQLKVESCGILHHRLFYFIKEFHLSEMFPSFAGWWPDGGRMVAGWWPIVT